MEQTGFLSDLERAELRRVLRRIHGDALAFRRANMLLLLDKGWTYPQIAEAFFLDESTILTVHRAYVAHGIKSLTAKHSPGAPTKLDAAKRDAAQSVPNLTKILCVPSANQNPVRAFLQMVFVNL